MSKLYLIIVVVFLMPLAALAGNVTLRGLAPDYAGFDINIERYDNFISRQRSSLAVINIDDKGAFSVTFDLDEVVYAFLDLGSYNAYIYISPNDDYQIVLPPHRPRSDADRFNPFYQPEQIELGIVNVKPCDLNISLRNFNEVFEQIFNANAINLVRRRDVVGADKLMSKVDSVAALFRCSENAFYDNYVEYCKARLYIAPRMRQQVSAFSQLFFNKPVLFNNSAYWSALDMLYPDFIASYSKSKRGRSFAKHLNVSTSFDSLSVALAADSLFADTLLRETVLIKGLFNAYYSQSLSAQLADSLLASAAANANNNQCKSLASILWQKINHLKQGSKAPAFSLYDLQGKRVELSDLQGKFVYLGFLHSENFACRKDMLALSALAKKYKRELTVVGILTDENAEAFYNYFKSKKFAWLPLSFIAMQRVVLDYDISVQPTYFLIDPEGTLQLSPAPAPTEGFEQTFINQMIKFNNDKLRKKPNKTRSIYDMVN